MAEQAEINEVKKAIDDAGSGGDTQDLNAQGGVITVAGTCQIIAGYVAFLFSKLAADVPFLKAGITLSQGAPSYEDGE